MKVKMEGVARLLGALLVLISDPILEYEAGKSEYTVRSYPLPGPRNGGPDGRADQCGVGGTGCAAEHYRIPSRVGHSRELQICDEGLRVAVCRLLCAASTSTLPASKLGWTFGCRGSAR